MLSFLGNDNLARTVSAAFPIPVTMAGSSGPQAVVGNVNSGAADSGAPVKVGAIYRNAGSGTALGNRTDLLADQYGNLRASVTGAVMSGSDAYSNASFVGLGYNNNTAQLAAPILAGNLLFNGASWDRARGSTIGAFVVQKGGASMATGQVAVTTSATLVVPARAGRQRVTLTPTTSIAYCVGNSDVTAATGGFVPAGASVTLETAAAVYVAGVAAVTISFIELF